MEARSDVIFTCHGDKQEQAVMSTAKIMALLTGVQFGKTTVGTLRMKMKMHTHTSPDDAFIVAAPTYKIMQQSTLPAFMRIMDGCGTYNKVDSTFRMKGGGICYFRTATEPDSIVGITNVRHILIDEAGKVSLYFWENAIARAAFRNCQIDLTSSPYALNWLFKQIVRPILKDRASRPDVELIQAASWENPEFPKETIEHAKLTMDPRRFRSMFGGVWQKMIGLVYDVFDDVENTCDPFTLPVGTRFVGGVDWGFSNPFALVVRAITPDGRHFQVFEFFRTGQTLSQKIEVARQAKAIFGAKPFYADPSSPESIEAFNSAGITTVAADNAILPGIDDHYELIKTRRYKVFRGTSPHTMDEYESYHWPEDKEDLGPDKDVVETKPVKQNEHSMDANRYITRMTRHPGNRKPKYPGEGDKKQETRDDRLKRLMRKTRDDTSEKWSA